jgi:Ceramidase
MTLQSRLDRREGYALIGIAVAIGAWVFLPEIAQPQDYHGFADQRAFLGVPNAADVLSNIPFVVVAVLGLWRLARNTLALPPVVKFSMYIFFTGLFLTGFGSAYYHWEPSDLTLVWDRLPMTIAFAGMLGALFGERITRRAGTAILVFMLVIGPGSVFYWKATDDLSVYVAVQFGAMAAVILTLLFTEKGGDPFPWWKLMAWYVVAKVLESADALVWVVTGGVFAGHALKHLAAAIGALAIANALRAQQVRSRVH